MPEGLLDHDAAPASILAAVDKSGRSQLLHDLREKLGRSRQVKKIVALRVLLDINRGQPLAELGERVRIAKITSLVEQAARGTTRRLRLYSVPAGRNW